MENYLSKLSSYDFLNYFLFGKLSLFLSYIFKLPFAIHIYDTINKFEGIVQVFSFLVIVYFLGLFVSRIGSLLASLLFFEPSRNKKKKFYQFKVASYKDFVIAERQDTKLSILVSQANIYRSLMGLAVFLFSSYTLEFFIPSIFRQPYSLPVIIIIAGGVFYLSWKRQSQYIYKRIQQSSD